MDSVMNPSVSVVVRVYSKHNNIVVWSSRYANKFRLGAIHIITVPCLAATPLGLGCALGRPPPIRYAAVNYPAFPSRE